MMKPADEKTHGAFAFKRETRVSGRWLDIGDARVEFDMAKVPAELRPLVPHILKAMRCHVFIDRTPIGGFSGHVFLSPLGEKPPVPQSKSQQAEREADPLLEEF